MENTKTPQTISNISPLIEPEKLLIALYWIWDAFDRSNMPFFLVLDTAKSAKANQDLNGSEITVGVRLMEWASGSKRILDSFIGEPISETNDKALYKHNDIPVSVHIYHDSESVINTDTIIYRNEAFKVPNPYSAFEKEYYDKSA